MNVTAEPFRAEHLREIEVQQAQIGVHEYAIEVGAVFERQRHAYTVRYGGRIILCGGLGESTLGDSHLWAVVAARAPLISVHRAALRFLSVVAGAGLTVATTEKGFAAGCRWLEMLGFKFERDVPGYGPFGDDHALYARVL